MHSAGSDYMRVGWQSIWLLNSTTSRFLRETYSKLVGNAALRQDSWSYQTVRVTRANKTWKPQLSIQDNRFQEYLMKSHQCISIFYQPSRRQAKNSLTTMWEDGEAVVWNQAVLGRSKDGTGCLLLECNRLKHLLVIWAFNHEWVWVMTGISHTR